MYKKENINSLYKNYSATRNEEFLTQLIEELKPIIDIILSKYQKYDRHFEDMSQEVKMRLWRNLRERTDENLQRYYINPTSYLYFLIREYCKRAFYSIYNIYQEDMEITLPTLEGFEDGRTV